MDAQPQQGRADLALLGVCTTVRGLLAGAERDEVLTRRRIGDILRTVSGAPHTYGARAIERVAEELGIHRRELYRYLRVAETWSEAELTALMARTTRFGRPLSWSHLLTLTTAKDRASVDALATQCLDLAWSVRDLASQLDELAAERRDGEDAQPSQGAVRTALKEGIQTGHRAVADVRRFASALEDRLTDRDAKLDDELLARALDTYEELRVQAAAAIEQLQVARGSRTRIKCATRSPSGTRVAVRERELAHDDDDVSPEPHARRLRVGG